MILEVLESFHLWRFLSPKVDPKHYKESEVQYLTLLYERTAGNQGTNKPYCPTGFSSVLKDCFYIKTTLCSTKFTQDAHLLELLQWVTKLKNTAEKTEVISIETHCLSLFSFLD